MSLSIHRNSKKKKICLTYEGFLPYYSRVSHLKTLILLLWMYLKRWLKATPSHFSTFNFLDVYNTNYENAQLFTFITV
jgi:hypothetical protein